jgi:hypothetical protein
MQEINLVSFLSIFLAKKDDEFLIQESVNIVSDAQLLVNKDDIKLDVASFSR